MPLLNFPTRLDQNFERAFTTYRREAARRALIDAVRTTPGASFGELLNLFCEDYYRLDDNDPLTIGELLGTDDNRRVVELVSRCGLPLECPLDAAYDIRAPLASL